MTIEGPTVDRLAFRRDIAEVLKKHAGHLDAQEMLALAAHLVGALIACQNRHTMTADSAMALVHHNIAIGNAEALENIEPPAPPMNRRLN